jgi:hypothetical protein
MKKSRNLEKFYHEKKRKENTKIQRNKGDMAVGITFK